jgi:hypothetical protein
MNVSNEYPQTAASQSGAGRNVWIAAAIVIIAVALVVLLAVRLTHALGEGGSQ